MKKITLILAVVLSFTYSYSATQKAYTKTKPIDSLYIAQEADEGFDFDYKSYLPKDFQAYDLSDNEADISQWVDEDDTDEAFDFDHTAYLPVGFNPNKEFNHLFLSTVKMVNEEEDAPFNFDIKIYTKKMKKVLVSLRK